MKQHPDVLLLLLKRFELDYSSMNYVKNNRNIDVPSSLQIPTTVNTQFRVYELQSCFFFLPSSISCAHQNQTYELYAVVDHCGDLRNGHYTATIRDGEDWYCFNDSRVTSVRANILGPTDY